MISEKKTERLQVTPNYAEVLYTPDRVERWLKGELTLQQLTAISGPEMLQMAIIGFRMYEQGRYADAKMIFQGLVTLDPTESYFLTALGAVHLAEEDLDAAKGYLDRSLALNPRELAAYVNRGEVLLRQGKALEAAQDFSRAVALDPQARDPLTSRAKVLAAATLDTLQKVTREAKAAKQPAGPAPRPPPAPAPARAAAAKK